MQFNLLAKRGLSKNILKFLFTSVFKFLRILYKKERETNSIAIIAFHKLGDSALTIPAIKAVLKRFPESKIKVFTFNGNQAIYELEFPSTLIETVNRNDFILDGRLASAAIRKKIVDFAPSHVIDLTGSIQSASAICTTSAKFIEGISLVYFKVLYDRFVPIRNTPRLTDIYLDVTAANYGRDFRLELCSYKRKNLEFNRIAIIVKAGWKAKEWDLRNFVALGEKLSHLYPVVFIADSTSTYVELNEFLTPNNQLELIQTDSIYDLIDQLKSVKLLIGNDSGPIHIANILGLATIALYGPTNPEFILPIGNHHKAIIGKVDCSPLEGVNYCALDAGRGCGNFKCMAEITVEKVYSEAVQLM